MSWSRAAQFAIGLLIIVGSIYTWYPRRRNRRVTLPPPSSACKRNTTQAVP